MFLNYNYSEFSLTKSSILILGMAKNYNQCTAPKEITRPSV